MVGINILLPGATQSLTFDPAQSQAAGVQIWPLIQAGEEFWGETDYVTDEKKGVRYDEGKDAGQPVYVAIAAARGGVKDERVEVESAKLVAVGNSEFALDAALNQQGLDFLLSSMNWLLDRGQLTGVVPKTVQHFSLHLSDAELSSIALYTMIVMPAVGGPGRVDRLVAPTSMSLVRTILLCALALAAIVFLAIYEPLTSSTREKVEAARQGRVLNLDPSKVREIHISTGVNQFDIKRTGNGWQLSTKPQDRADSAMVEELLKSAAEMKYFDRMAAREFKPAAI